MANYCLLGEIQFEILNSPTSLSFTTKNNYTEHAKIDGKPTLQLVGSDLNTIQLDLHFNWQFCDPDARLRQLIAAKDKGEAMALIFGGGQYRGNYVIESLSCKTIRTNTRGEAITIDVQASLKEWRTAIRPKVEVKKQESPFKKLTSPAALTFDPKVIKLDSPDFSISSLNLK